MNHASPPTTTQTDHGILDSVDAGAAALHRPYATPSPAAPTGTGTTGTGGYRTTSGRTKRNTGITARSRQHQQWIHSIVRANPGIHVRRIAVLTGLAWNTVRHHLRRLQATEMVVEVKDQGRLCYFDRSRGSHRHKGASVLLREPRNVAIAKAVAGGPPRSQRELARELGLAASVISRRIDRLESAGLVHRLQQARCILVQGADHLEEVLDQADPWGAGITDFLATTDVETDGLPEEQA